MWFLENAFIRPKRKLIVEKKNLKKKYKYNNKYH